MRAPFLNASRDHPEFFSEENYPSKGRVRMITVLPEFRGRGILHVIFDGFEKIGADRGFNALHMIITTPES